MQQSAYELAEYIKSTRLLQHICSSVAAHTPEEQDRAFSNFSVTGGGLAAVMPAAISSPMANASARLRPGSSTNSESVSPYTTRARHSAPPLAVTKPPPRQRSAYN